MEPGAESGWSLLKVGAILVPIALALVLFVSAFGAAAWLARRRLARAGNAAALRTFWASVACGLLALASFVAMALLMLSARASSEPGGSGEFTVRASVLFLALGGVLLGALLGFFGFAGWTVWHVVNARRAPA